MYDLDKYPILRTYSLFKKDFTMSKHLICVKNAKHRTAISKIRCSSHLLSIERGRHTNPTTLLENRLCFVCKTLEDEIHFICDCGLYSENRKTFFAKVKTINSFFDHLDSKEKFIFLFSSDNTFLLTWLGQFIFESYEIRSINLRNHNLSSAH